MTQFKHFARKAGTAFAASLMMLGAAQTATAQDDIRDAVAQYEAAIATAESTTGKGHPAMWTLQDDDTVIHIFGSFHLLKPDVEWRTEAFDEAFAASDILVLEADATSPEAVAKMGQLMGSLGQFSDGTTISSLLSKEELKLVTTSMQSVNLPLAVVDNFKPWFATLALSQTQMAQAGFSPNAGVEMVLTSEAEERGMSFAYLETVEDQLGIFANDPIEEQVEALVFAAQTLDLGSVALNTLADEWADGDTEGLTAMVGNESIFPDRDDYEALLVNRNANWIPQIENMLDYEGTIFVAVGAGHLVGDDSVIAMLKSEGYTVSGPN